MNDESTPPNSSDALRPTRRTFVVSSIAAGTVGLVALFGRGAARAATATTLKRPSSATTKAKTAATAPKASAASGSADFPDGNELLIAFTYSASSGGGGGRGGFGGGPGGGRVRNPFVAVWVEDSAGAMVRTIDLSIQLDRGQRWWPDLKRWWNADQARIAAGGADVIGTISSATKIPGTHQVAWDGRTQDGSIARQGEYVVLIEGAREHGPYSLVRQPVTIGSSAFSTTPANNGELTSVRIELKRRSA